MNNWDIAFTIFIIAAVFALGWSGSELYEDFSNERKFNGLYIHYSPNETVVNEITNTRDSRGDWVCINVAYEMTPEVAYRTCVHECTHKAFSEIYSEECEQHPSECFKEIWGTNG